MLSSESLCLRLDDSVGVIRVVLSAVNYLFKDGCTDSKATLGQFLCNEIDKNVTIVGLILYYLKFIIIYGLFYFSSALSKCN